MKRSYHTIDKQGKVGQRKLTEFLVRNGQALLPMMELIEHSRMAIEQLIDVMGRASIEALLQLSAARIAGAPCRLAGARLSPGGGAVGRTGGVLHHQPAGHFSASLACLSKMRIVNYSPLRRGTNG